MFGVGRARFGGDIAQGQSADEVLAAVEHGQPSDLQCHFHAPQGGFDILVFEDIGDIVAHCSRAPACRGAKAPVCTTPRTTMSRSVIAPIRRRSWHTGRDLDADRLHRRGRLLQGGVGRHGFDLAGHDFKDLHAVFNARAARRLRPFLAFRLHGSSGHVGMPPETTIEKGIFMRKLVWLAVAGLAVLGAATAGAQTTPRKGGTIRADSALRRELRQPGSASSRRARRTTSSTRRCSARSTTGTPPTPSWCSSFAKSVSVSDDGSVYTWLLRDDALPSTTGRKMTADDIIYSYTRIMDGAKGYPGARYVRLIKGATEVEKGTAQEISGLRKIDDFTLEMTITDKVDPGYYFFSGTTAILPKEEVEKANFAAASRRPGSLQVQGTYPGQQGRRRALHDQVLQTGVLLRRHARGPDHGRGRGARRRFPQQGDRHFDPGPEGQYVAYRADPELLEAHPRRRRNVHPLDADEPDVQGFLRAEGAPG